MAILNIRYGGQIVSLDNNGFNFNPSTYGTARLNVNVNSSSTAKFGLTTNTNAKEYCKMAVRVGGQIAYLGRVSSTEYISGDTVDRNGSSVVSSITALSTNGAGSGTGTAAANPTIRTVTNATGSSVTSSTTSAQIASETWYSFVQGKYTSSSRTLGTSSWSYPSTGEAKAVSTYRTISTVRAGYHASVYVAGTNYNAVTARLTNAVTSTNLNSSYQSTKSSNRSITHFTSKKTAYNTTTGAWVTVGETSPTVVIPTNLIASAQTIRYISRTSSNHATSSRLGSADVASAGTKNTYATQTHSSIIQHVVGAKPTIQTVYRYSTRWSYSWTSCSKLTAVSETLHNMNI